MRWLIRVADRTHPLVLPGVWVLLTVSATAYFLGNYGGQSCCWSNVPQMWGSALTFILIPGYLMAAFPYLYRSHRDTVRDLKPLVADVQAFDLALGDVPTRVAIGAGVFGVLFGTFQFAEVLFGDSYQASPLPDYPLIVGNILLWTIVALVTVARLRDALAMRRLGLQLEIDLYHPARIRPVGRAAIRDVLVVMGALAFMPLQSLDAEFRWVNYQTGLAVGLVSSALLFYLPVSGVRAAVVRAKGRRLEALEAAIDSIDRSNVPELEALVAHRERIQHLSTWPVDLSILSRVGFYLIIPPLAWVGAALVETLVQGYIE